MSKLSVSIVTMLCACGAPAADDDFVQGDGHDQISAPVEGMESQGRHLLGKLLDDLRAGRPFHVSIDTDKVLDADGNRVPGGVVLAGSASLEAGGHRGADPWFDGVVLGGTGGGELELAISRGGSDVTFYNLRYRARPEDEWFDPCLADDPEGKLDHHDAVPLAGRWDASGLHHADPAFISFACSSGAAYKCTEWTYLAGTDDTSELWRAHQACTRMTRGDYCANGRTHTREGTQITMHDFVGVGPPIELRYPGVTTWPPEPDEIFFEAAWNDGAEAASCLSRVRWQSLPLGGVCDDGVPRDPRQDSALKFCEDFEFPAPEGEITGPILVNLSRYSDLGFHVWQNGDDLVSTVRGFYEPAGTLPTFPPFQNVPVGTYTFVQQDSLLVRSQRLVVDLAELEEVRLYVRAGDLVVAGVSQPPPGFVTSAGDAGFEGFVYKVPTGASQVPLRMFKHATTGDYFSTTTRPTDPAYELQWTIGYTLALEEKDPPQ